MSISGTAYMQISREYDEKQLAARRDQLLRISEIEERIPEIAVINAQIAQMSVARALDGIRGRAEDKSVYEEKKKNLIEKRSELLAAAGYPHGYMEPVYECSICQDTGYVGNEKCACLRSRMIEILYDQSNIKKILEKENFNTYTFKYYRNEQIDQYSDETPLSIAKKAVEIARDFIDKFDSSSDNLFISGETGTGKTFLGNCIAKEILDRGHDVIYLSAVKLFDILADNSFGGRSEERIAEDLFSCELLIIDDLGTEYTNSFIQSAFFNCINERLLRKKHTIISTNLSMEQIRQNYSERVFSRLAKEYTFIKLFGDDIRIRKKLEG